MIIYDKRQKHNLIEFGIEIPISDSTPKKTFEYLTKNPLFYKNIDKWLISEINEKITKEDLLRVHSAEYVKKLFSNDLDGEIIKTFELIDNNGKYYRYNPLIATLPFSYLFDDILTKVAGTYLCCKIALEKGFCFYFGGGMHHAKKDNGEGFCVVNDIVIVSRRLQFENKIQKIWIIDVDAHKGDGTAAITSDDKSIITLSIHMAKGWPLDGEMYIDGKLNQSFIPSDIDIPVDADENDKYLEKLNAGLKELKKFGNPDIALIVNGSDPYEYDELPSTKDLKLTLSQMKERDLMIYNFLKLNKIPQAYLMAGGYGEKSWEVYSQFLEIVLMELNFN